MKAKIFAKSQTLIQYIVVHSKSVRQWRAKIHFDVVSTLVKKQIILIKFYEQGINWHNLCVCHVLLDFRQK